MFLGIDIGSSSSKVALTDIDGKLLGVKVINLGTGNNVADEALKELLDNLGAKGVIVLCEAEHTCMTARGIRKVGSKTTTYAVLGDIDEANKLHILSLMR